MKESKERSRAENNEDQRELLGTTGDGAKVYDRTDSHLHTEGGLTPDLLAAALHTIDTHGERFVRKQVDFDHVIGKSSSVELQPDDDVVMVFRKGRNGPTPMVKNREKRPCNSMMIVLVRDDRLSRDRDAYVLLTAFIGDDAPREPWDPANKTEEEIRESEEYWRTHALVYDESLIDLEKTEKYSGMSEEERKVEALREKTIYTGLFVDPQALYSQAPATLKRRIKNPHVTTSFHPEARQLKVNQIGSRAKIIAIGYGNDGRVEGLLVRVEADDPDLQQACDEREAEVPLHITLSCADGASPKETGYLEFHKLEEPIELTGTYGLFIQGKVVTDKTEALK